jgi:X-linked retinitis pigmentosa GTPase regulator
MAGNGENGQLGLGMKKNEFLPKLVNSLPENAIQVACGQTHSLVLLRDGKVYSMGANNYGQLGTGNRRSSNLPTGLRQFELTQAVKIAAGSHSAAVTTDGDLYIWGSGSFGELLQP